MKSVARLRAQYDRLRERLAVTEGRAAQRLYPAVQAAYRRWREAEDMPRNPGHRIERMERMPNERHNKLMQRYEQYLGTAHRRAAANIPPTPGIHKPKAARAETGTRTNGMATKDWRHYERLARSFANKARRARLDHTRRGYEDKAQHYSEMARAVRLGITRRGGLKRGLHRGGAPVKYAKTRAGLIKQGYLPDILPKKSRKKRSDAGHKRTRRVSVLTP
jgi:hypothetical protein